MRLHAGIAQRARPHVHPAALLAQIHGYADDAPTLIIQGDKDRLVPVQQSERMKEEMGKKQIPVSVQYKQGAEHTWQNMAEERKEFVKWFDHYLRGK